MEWETVPKCGHLLIDDKLEDAPGKRMCRDFLETLVREFPIRATEYDVLYPFTSSEKQLYSLFTSTLLTTCPLTLGERRVIRHIDGESRLGWVDYQVVFRSLTALIELKLHRFATRSPSISSSGLKKWKEANKQVRSILKQEALDHLLVGHIIAKMSIMMTPCYKASSSKENVSERVGKEECMKYLKLITRKLTPKPDWSCIWSLAEHLQGPFEIASDKYEMYPAIAIHARVTTVQR